MANMGQFSTNVSLYGAVPIKVGDEELVSLTGSASILEIGGKRILIDLGMFQGGEGSDTFNKENIGFLKGIDGVVITHPHIDHIGRIPLLYKYGYRGAIYMTSATRDITREMLLDSLKIQEGDIIERLNRNKKLGFRLREALKIKEGIIRLNKNNFSDSDEKSAIKSYIDGKLGIHYSFDDIILQLNDYLGFYDVKKEDDIKNVINKLSEYLFDNDDLQGVMDLVQTVEYGEEKVINSNQVNYDNGNLANQDLLENLPLELANGYEGEIHVNKNSEKRKLNKLRKEKLRASIIESKNNIKINSDLIEEKKDILRKNLKTAFFYCKGYIDNPEDLNKEGFLEVKNQFDIYQKYLKTHGVFGEDDIEKLVKDVDFVIDYFKIGIDFNSDDIFKASRLLKVSGEKYKQRNILGFTLQDAAHIIGAASIIFTSGEVKDKVKTLMGINGNATTVYFSGDLGRIKDNRLGRPEIPTMALDYLQIESTYGGRNHTPREESVGNLTKSINDSEGNVLISTFSQQRTQEVLLTLLEEIQKGKLLFEGQILVDAPLAKKVTNLYFKYGGKVYDLLKEESQKKVFGRVVFRFLKEEEWQDIYRKKEKHIILASSGMMDGGAILNHLPHILGDEKATILAPGYLSRGTLGNKIIFEEDSEVTVSGNKYKVNCNKKFIDGFSSHIGHDEILQFIDESIKFGKLKKGSTIALSHGNIKGQELLKSDIEKILDNLNRNDIIVTIPKLFERYNIGNNNFGEISPKDSNLVKIGSKKKCIVPEFLLGKKDEDIKEDNLELVIPENVNKIKKQNSSDIEKIRERISNIRFSKDDFLKKLLFKSFKQEDFIELSDKFSKILDFETSKRELFYSAIDKKLIRSRDIKSKFSSFKNNIKNTTNIYNRIIEYTVSLDNNTIIVGKIEKELLILEEEYQDFLKENQEKNSDNKSTYEFYEKGLKNKRKKLNNKKSDLSKIKSAIKNQEEILFKELKLNIPDDYHYIFNDVTNITLEKLKTICNYFIENIEFKLGVMEGKLDSLTNFSEDYLLLDLNTSVIKLNKQCLEFLSTIFKRDYFKNYILLQFNIFLFLKSKTSFKKYILSKFDLTQLKLEGEDIGHYNSELLNIDKQDYLLDKIELLNNDLDDLFELNKLSHGIDETGKKIDLVIDEIDIILKNK